MKLIGVEICFEIDFMAQCKDESLFSKREKVVDNTCHSQPTHYLVSSLLEITFVVLVSLFESQSYKLHDTSMVDNLL